VRFGQGFLFSPPRPVRTEVLQGIADRPTAPERAAVPAPAPAPRAAERPAPPVESEAAPLAEAGPGGDRRATALAQLARGIVRRAQG